MKKKWNELEIFHKSIIFSGIYSFILIIISLILLLDDTSWIYGTLIGTGLLFISYLIIWILWFKISKIKIIMSKGTSVLIPLIRIVLFLLILHFKSLFLYHYNI